MISTCTYNVRAASRAPEFILHTSATRRKKERKHQRRGGREDTVPQFSAARNLSCPDTEQRSLSLRMTNTSHWRASATVDVTPVLSFVDGTSRFQQSFNPAWVSRWKAERFPLVFVAKILFIAVSLLLTRRLPSLPWFLFYLVGGAGELALLLRARAEHPGPRDAGQRGRLARRLSRLRRAERRRRGSAGAALVTPLRRSDLDGPPREQSLDKLITFLFVGFHGALSDVVGRKPLMAWSALGFATTCLLQAYLPISPHISPYLMAWSALGSATTC